ncbi:MAG: hypothetical protein H6509_15190 [Bryobacterales bacterium]|nr:hypothetical protein [Bryobacterales bacterium]
MPAATWKFREKHQSEMHQELAHTEFFANQNVADRLVREVGQNTLDASSEGATARLSFRFVDVSPEVFPEYFGPLWPHLQAEKDLRGKLPATSGAVPVLVVEDFGTTGLTGPLEAPSGESDEPASRLFWFFKNVGRTSKSDGQRGSFGIGKTVFPFSSRINTFFGFTTRRERDGTLSSVLLGQAHLREHRLTPSGPNLDPIGFYARYDRAGDRDQQHPIADPVALERFRTLFGLTRKEGETGLSVVIAYPDKHLTAEGIGQALVEHYFLPILSGDLIADVDLNGQAVRLSASTLLDRAGDFSWEDGQDGRVRRRLELASWACSDDAGRRRVQLGAPSDDGSPKLDESVLSDKDKAALSRRYLSGERLALRVPTPVERIGARAIHSNVDVFLEYDPKLGSSDETYAREGLILADHRRLANQSGLRSILIAQGDAISALLRASENVSHTEWRRRGVERLTSQYDRGTKKVAFVLELVPGIVQALLSPSEKADTWTLSDFFPAPQPGEVVTEPPAEPDSPGEGDGDQSGTIEFPPIGPAKVRQWRAKPSANGLVIEGNPAFDGPMRAMQLTVAYAVPTRPAFSSHSRDDFSFFDEAEMFGQQGNASIQPIGDNVLYIRPTGGPYRVEVTGFDPHRALDFRIRAVDSEAD